MTTASAPGKLFISGEWAVLEMGNPGLVAAVDKRVYAKIEDSPDDYFYITLKDFNITRLKFSYEKGLKAAGELAEDQQKKLKFILSAVNTLVKYTGVSKPLQIETWGKDTTIEYRGGTHKIGFGSSAASTVAVVSAVLRHQGRRVQSYEDKLKIFKLAAAAHYFAQGKVGSGFDVAASTFGGVFMYERFDPAWLVKQIQEGNLQELMEQKWQGLKIEQLSIPEDFNLIIGWTGRSASTSEMVKQINKWGEKNPEDYRRHIDSIAETASEVIDCWKKDDRASLIKHLNKNHEVLASLGKDAGVEIETDTLQELHESAKSCGGAGKLSGAGGGDCGIGICFDNDVEKEILKNWQDNGIFLVKANIAHEGIRLENGRNT